jgi:hypothetical protein
LLQLFAYALGAGDFPAKIITKHKESGTYQHSDHHIHIDIPMRALTAYYTIPLPGHTRPLAGPQLTLGYFRDCHDQHLV